MSATAPDFTGAQALAAQLAAGSVGALELCDAAIARIERLDGAINAVVVRDFERAREAARERDRRLARGERAPLLGVPMTVKESFDVAGLPSSWGLAAFAGRPAARDAVLVQRLQAAGAVIVGKTNVAPALADWQSANPVYGRTVNPHDATRSPGGSSGGSAAALAAGLVPLELGSDIGGSVRVPAHFCGVVGHKPSFGLLPLTGHDFPGTDGVPVELAVAGPLARNVDDAELALKLLAGPAGRDAVGYRLALPPPRRRLAGSRLLLLDQHPCARVDSAVKAALERLAGQAEAAGAHVERADGRLPDLQAGHRNYLAMLNTIFTRGQPGGRAPLSAHDWFDRLDDCERARRRWAELFETVDAVLAPPFGTVAFPHTDEPDWSRRTLPIDGQPTPYGDQLAWPGIANHAGLPATVVPIGRGSSGLPIGVQVIGPYLGDLTTLALARELMALAAL